MTNDHSIIREILPTDNIQIAKVIRSVLIEMGVPKIGTAYEDIALDCMYETYNNKNSIYYVLVSDNNIIGGAGIAQLDGAEGFICEFQKMYFLPEARGKGLGSKMIEICLNKAKQLGYKQCYLETLPYMKAATALYLKNGFTSLKAPVGNTGHFSCNVWMLKDL